MTSSRSILFVALPVAVGLASSVACAQDLQPRPGTPPPPPPPTATSTTAADNVVEFSADQVEYGKDNDTVTATGDVRMFREGNRLRADKVVWNRTSGQVVATGNVAVTNPQGDVAYGDSTELTDTLKDGVVENLLIVMEDGGRLAAVRGTRKDDISTLENAAYTPCAVVDDKGCPKNPTWKVTAARVTYNPGKGRIYYRGARVEMFGLPLIPLPGLSTPTDNSSGSGLLVPNFQYNRVNGLEFALPYYLQIASNRDLTITPHIYTNVLPLAEVKYRALTSTGAYQITGLATSSTVQPAGVSTPISDGNKQFRGYIDASGRFQLDPYWDISGSIRVVTDRTFLRRYNYSYDDRLRSTVKVERIGQDSYFSIAGWATQTLRANDPEGGQPIALPEIDYRRRLTDPLLGGTIDLQLNSLAITRTAGQDTQRAFTGARWDLRRYTPLGQEVTFTAYTRADVYHTDDTLLTSTVSYRGDPGWHVRGIAALAVDVKWPFIGELFGGTQRITPRVQIVASPNLSNLKIPNEDSRAFDLEDSNLFALNRFPGYDRYEDGQRITYGFDYSLALPGFSIDANVGQSYRLDSKPQLFPDGTGLSGRTSDIVGRATVRFRDFVTFTERFRLDKDTLAIRRNEVDATIGSRKTYVLFGYLRLNRDIDPSIEDLRDREELRFGGRVQFAKYWSLFGSTIIDLTDKNEDPLSLSDGFQPIRHRLGLSYEDDCLELGFTWRRDYEDTGDARKGNSFLLRLAFKNLGG